MDGTLLKNSAAGAVAEDSRFRLSFARSEDEVRDAQRLRYKVFAEEFGAQLDCRIPGHDSDIYDPYCEHLLVRETESERVVGTYRILSPDAARRVGGYYSENEFSLTRFEHLRNRMVEVGRSCIHPDHRRGAVIALLWAGLADYMVRNKHEYLVGCGSIGMADGGHNAANLFREIAANHLAPVEYHVFPKYRLPVEKLANGQPVTMPPLIKGYLRAGAWVCGEPAWDPDFNTADLLLLLPLARLNARHLRHFIKPGA